MKIIVTGGRTYKDINFVFHVLNKIHEKQNISLIINGGAKGADSLSTEWAKKNNITYKIYPANWKQHGPSAGPIRNKQMIEENLDANFLLAFPGGHGTENAVQLAINKKMKIIDFRFERNENEKK